MRRSAGMLLLILSLIFSLFAQEQHTKKVYFDSKHNKVFWPAGKDFFVKLSESPDSSAPSFLLSSKDSTKGFQLHLSGLHYLRWVDPFKGDTTLLYFISDGEKPNCQIVFNKNKFILNQNKFYGKGLKITFNAQDRYSGIENVYVSIDNEKYVPVTDTLIIDKEKEHSISFYAVDKVGNVGKSQTSVFNMDLTPPVTNITVNGNQFGTEQVLSNNQSITLKAFDSLSGVKETWYHFNQNGNFIRAYSPIKLTNFKDGNHSITFYSVDNVGVAESLRTVTFYIDNTAPTVTLGFEGDHFSSKNINYISGKTALSITGNDNKSGIDQIEYTLSKDKFSVYSAPFSLPVQPGKFLIGICAIDKKGNRCPIKYYNAMIDSKPPRSKVTITGPLFKNGIYSYISGNTKISLSAEDDLSGIKRISYMSDDTASTDYSGPFSITKEGRLVVRYFSVDNVNNREDTQAVVVMLDNTPPTIIETFSVTPGANQNNQSSIKIPLSTSLFLAATDNAAGVNEIWYSFDGKKELKYTQPLVFGNKGLFNLTLKSKDNVGNTAEKKLTIEVIE